LEELFHLTLNTPGHIADDDLQIRQRLSEALHLSNSSFLRKISIN
jgi:hypothetical protein